MHKLAPIVLFTYNRLDTLKLTIESLQKNYLAKESELIIFSDCNKNNFDKLEVQNVRTYLKLIDGFKSVTIHESPENRGLANSIISGVTTVFETYDTVIVLEDDLVSSPNFLDFMNESLTFFFINKKYYSINEFSLKTRFNPSQRLLYSHSRASSWGWSTWKDRWDKEYFDRFMISNKIKNNPNVLMEFKKKMWSRYA